MKPIYYIVPLLNFLLATLLGLLLRALFVFPIEGITFLYVLHTHSHIALLGWLYLLVYVLLIEKFGIKKPIEDRFYKRLFWVTQFAVLGMAVTFPFQGYAAASISFSTLHIICSYIFVIHLWRKHSTQTKQEALLLKTALFFMTFSTLGVWFLGPAVGMLGKASAFYQICIQFFLHFQFDGWFLTAFLALMFSYLFNGREIQGYKTFYVTWCISIVLTYALPLSWYVKYPLLHYINGIGVVLQLCAFSYLIGPYKTYWKEHKKDDTIYIKSLLLLAAFCFTIRIFVQLGGVWETLAISLKALRSWIIGFIHLNMLGVLSGFGLWMLVKSKFIAINILSKIGIVLLLFAFFSSELLLLVMGGQGYFWGVLIPTIPMWIFWASALFPLSITCILFSSLLKR
ncbi:hypothetical protein [Myroides injenensis]|uniref:hypothetical protein n=1 Tax=Myroides injenensis TaxID=1183151 RepID=UPI00028A32DD|nr:hypothetical protein [Myroides injenensis]